MNKYKFELGEQGTLKSGEAGEIVGRSEYTASENSYLLRYTAADGRQVEGWWAESAFA